MGDAATASRGRPSRAVSPRVSATGPSPNQGAVTNRGAAAATGRRARPGSRRRDKRHVQVVIDGTTSDGGPRLRFSRDWTPATTPTWARKVSGVKTTVLHDGRPKVPAPAMQRFPERSARVSAARRGDARRNGTAPGVAARGLAKTFATPQGTVRAVRGVDLSLAPGETVALLGPNGAGKSTTIDLLLGLGRPDAGTVSSSARRRRAVAAGRVAAMLQTGGLIRDLSVARARRR